MFIAALFTIAKAQKQPKCPSTDDWIKKMWYIYTHCPRVRGPACAGGLAADVVFVIKGKANLGTCFEGLHKHYLLPAGRLCGAKYSLAVFHTADSAPESHIQFFHLAGWHEVHGLTPKVSAGPCRKFQEDARAQRPDTPSRPPYLVTRAGPAAYCREHQSLVQKTREPGIYVSIVCPQKLPALQLLLEKALPPAMLEPLQPPADVSQDPMHMVLVRGLVLSVAGGSAPGPLQPNSTLGGYTLGSPPAASASPHQSLSSSTSSGGSAERSRGCQEPEGWAEPSLLALQLSSASRSRSSPLPPRVPGAPRPPPASQPSLVSTVAAGPGPAPPAQPGARPWRAPWPQAASGLRLSAVISQSPEHSWPGEGSSGGRRSPNLPPWTPTPS
ncbi:Mediator of RNA polymerase II transcription subunit 25 [Camelus dromedarius]|uniref:Mediator of RNA polymerase II transcription subunit 25 n=1 Tax=Camelus dromedarius TaxID=9838 RepID=A0A5N4CBQ9_CAMDR|nr:Mediator of RNA polymerase II transcription subunit 25 [Camelus dromedarius]